MDKKEGVVYASQFSYQWYQTYQGAASDSGKVQLGFSRNGNLDPCFWRVP
jgi:hypothetical protein